MTIDEVIMFYGNPYRFEAATGIKQQNVRYWKKKGYIPITMQRRIQQKSRGKLKMDEIELEQES